MALFGTAIIIFLFARLVVNPVSPGSARITIGPASAWPFPSLSAESRQLYNMLQARADELNTPVSADPSLEPFNVEPGETAVSVAERLQGAGLISDAGLFLQVLNYNEVDTQLKAGVYQLPRNLTMRQVGQILVQGHPGGRVVTMFAGWRMEELAQHLAAAGLMDGRFFLEQARQGTAVNHPLLAGRPAGQSYEGYLFPGVYPLPENATPADLIAAMLNNMAGQLPADAFSLARQRGLAFYQVLILASIVQRETSIPQEQPLVASVYLNRLKPENSQPYLQADPTVQYALGYQADTKLWWKTFITLEEYSLVDSPYNTYRYPGLPPGPIASPGIEAILAVLRPAETNYLFFVCRQPRCAGGDHVFAETYEEHLQNARVYWAN